MLLAAAVVQATEVPWRALRPMCKLRDNPMAPVVLVLYAVIALGLSSTCIYCGTVPHVYRELWKYRLPAVFGEILICMHTTLPALAVAQLWEVLQKKTATATEATVGLFFMRPTEDFALLAFCGAMLTGELKRRALGP